MGWMNANLLKRKFMLISLKRKSGPAGVAAAEMVGTAAVVVG
jgi:hypothetical protein